MPDDIKQLVIEVEEDRVADEVAAGVRGDVLLGLSGSEVAEVLAPKRLSRSKAPGPRRKKSVMWWDWSNSTQQVRQARCSERQLVNSGATGKAYGRAGECRSSSTGDPARLIAASRLSDPMAKHLSVHGSHRRPFRKFKSLARTGA
jgi:hypothetical protein